MSIGGLTTIYRERESFLTKTLNCEEYYVKASDPVNWSSEFIDESNITSMEVNYGEVTEIIDSIDGLPLVTVVTVIVAVGIVGNALLYMMMSSKHKKRSTYSLLVRATSVFDSLNLIFEGPSIWFFSRDLVQFSSFLCDTISFVGMFTKMISSYFLILSTCDKLIMISRPLQWRIICNNSNIRRCITLIVLLSFVVSVVYICIVRIFSYCLTTLINFEICWKTIGFGSSPIVDIISYCLLYSISFIPCIILAVTNSISVFLMIVHSKKLDNIGCGSLQRVPYVALVVLTLTSFLSFIPFVFLDIIAFGYGYIYDTFYLMYILQFANKFYILVMISATFRKTFYKLLKNVRKSILESFQN